MYLIVPALYCCAFAAKYLGYPDLAMTAAKHAQRAAERLGEPVWRGVADFTRVQSLPPELKCLSRRLADDVPTGLPVRQPAWTAARCTGCCTSSDRRRAGLRRGTAL